jgi:hypothetical protein
VQYLTRGTSAITRSPLTHVHLKLALSDEHTVHECACLGACSRHDFFSAPKQRGGGLAVLVPLGKGWDGGAVLTVHVHRGGRAG